MPYVIRPYKKTGKFRVCKKNTKKCFSRRPMTKRNAKRQLAAIYTNSGERQLRSRRAGGSRTSSRKSMSPSKCTYPYHITQSKLSNKDLVAVNTIIDRVKTFIGSYTPLALCHFIKSHKSIIFSESKKCGDIGKATHTMKTYYKLLNIDSITSHHTSPKNPLTLHKTKTLFNTIISQLSTRQHQVGGQERPMSSPIQLAAATLFFLAMFTLISTLGVITDEINTTRIMNREMRGYGIVFNEEILSRMPLLLLLSILSTTATAYDEFRRIRNDANAGDVGVGDVGDIDDIDILDDDEFGIDRFLIQGRQGPVPVNSFRIIKRIRDMPQVPENLSDCGICRSRLVEPDELDSLKNAAGYIVQLHPDQGHVPHMYHFACIKSYFRSQLGRRLPTWCLVDEIDINGNELVDTEIDESVDGTNFFKNGASPRTPSH